MSRNARGPGVEKVMKPTKYENMLNPIPLARRFVGKISAHQTKDGASMNWYSTINYRHSTVSIYSNLRLNILGGKVWWIRWQMAYQKDKSYRCSIASLVSGSKILALEQTLDEKVDS
jgi:hypothetical protein